VIFYKKNRNKEFMIMYLWMCFIDKYSTDIYFLKRII